MITIRVTLRNNSDARPFVAGAAVRGYGARHNGMKTCIVTTNERELADVCAELERDPRVAAYEVVPSAV